VDIHLTVENKGQTIRGFKKIKFRVFAMKAGREPSLFQCRDGAKRLALQDACVTEEINYTFSVEPGIRQIFPLTTLIDSDMRYVIVKVDVETEQWGDAGSPWLGEERFFPVTLEPRSNGHQQQL
jgi:hypothetical protein